MGNALDKAETAVVVVAGIAGLGILYGLYRKVLSPLGCSLSELSDKAEQAYSVAQESGVGAGYREWENPACSNPNDPDCVPRVEPDRQPILDEHGNIIGYRPKGGYNTGEQRGDT